MLEGCRVPVIKQQANSHLVRSVEHSVVPKMHSYRFHVLKKYIIWPFTILSLQGRPTLTRIKDFFIIFKEFVVFVGHCYLMPTIKKTVRDPPC